MEMIQIGGLGLLAEGFGLLTGILLLYVFCIKDQRMMGMLFGGTSGMMLAMICFDVLPEALSKGRIELVFVGMVIGLLSGLLIDDVAFSLERHTKRKVFYAGKMGVILALGIALHNLPEGFALGALGQTDDNTLMQFAVVLALHSIPEGIALAIPFKKAQTSLKSMLLVALILSGIMAVGAMGGYFLSGISEGLICTGLGLAAGIILYIICEELLPESKKLWNGRLTTLATILGLMLGLLILYH